MDPDEFVKKAVEDFPSGDHAKEFVLRTVGVIRWGFSRLKEFDVKISEAALKTLDTVQGWAQGRLDISEVEAMKKIVGPALISARGAFVTTRLTHLECEKDALNLMEFLINTCVEMAKAATNSENCQAKDILCKFYSMVRNDIPQLIERVDHPRGVNFHLGLSVDRFFADDWQGQL